MAEKKKIGIVKNNIIRLPPGFRFHPTDEELVVQYLRRKVLSFPLPASIIPEVDVSKYDPWDLPPGGGGGGGGGRGGGSGDSSEEERYYFSTNEAKYRKGNRTNRATGSGYWKATGVDKRIVAPRSNHQLVGMKKTLVFYRGKPPSGSRTDWIMHEYRLAAGTAACINGVAPHTNNNNNNNSIIQSSVMQMEDWVLCRIFLKKRNSKNDNNNNNNNNNNVNAQTCNNTRVQTLGGVSRPNLIDFMMVEKTDMRSSSSSSYSSSSSSASSIITDVSLDHDDCNSVSSSS